MLLTSLLFLHLNFSIASAKDLEVGLFNFAPFYIVKENQYKGILTDLLKKLMEKNHLKYHMTDYPTKRLYLNLADGTTDIFIGVKNAPDYQGKVFYSKSPVMEIKLCSYSINNTPIIKNKNELKNKHVIVVHGYSYAGFITELMDPKNKNQIEITVLHNSGIQMLLEHRADYLIDYKDAGDEFIKTHKDISLNCGIISTTNLYLIISKATPNGERLMEKLEGSLLNQM